jgi:hypothetical protein
MRCLLFKNSAKTLLLYCILVVVTMEIFVIVNNTKNVHCFEQNICLAVNAYLCFQRRQKQTRLADQMARGIFATVPESGDSMEENMTQRSLERLLIDAACGLVGATGEKVLY